MTVAFQRMFGILERWNNNQVTPSLSKPRELSYISNKLKLQNIKINKSSEIYEKSVSWFLEILNLDYEISFLIKKVYRTLKRMELDLVKQFIKD